MINFKKITEDFGPISLIPLTDREYVLDEIRKLKNGSRVLEVGTFIAGTTIHLAKARPDIKIYTIDINKWVNNDIGPGAGLAKHLSEKFNIDNIDDDFILNLQRAYAEPYANITLLTGNSLELDIDDLDLVYLDGNHQYEHVLNELHYYYDRLNDNGVIMGDDVNANGVYDALRMFCLEKNLEYSIYSKTFKIFKSGDTGLSDQYIASSIAQFGPLDRARHLYLVE